MSKITVDYLASLTANPPRTDALPGLIFDIRTRRDYLKNISTVHSTALGRERKRFKVANTPISPFS